MSRDAALYEGREHAVPCRTCRRMTWRVDAFCVRCRPVAVETDVPPSVSGEGGAATHPPAVAAPPSSQRKDET